jgi:NitT/TauT family transport system substrate-binding protein
MVRQRQDSGERRRARGVDRKWARAALLVPLGVAASGIVQATAASAKPRHAAANLGNATVLATLGGAPFLSTAPQTSIPFALGHWRKQGLNVTLNELGSESTDAEALALIASHPGSLETAPVARTSLMTAEQKGLPVIGVYVWLREGLNSIYVLKNSPITQISQLDGKTIGTYSPPPGGPYAEADFMIDENGGNAKSVNIINIGYSPATVQALQNGSAAAYVVTEADYFDATGNPMRILPDKTFTKRFGFVWAVSTSQVKNNPAGITALLRGFAEASLFAQTNRTAALLVHWKMYPDSKPTGMSQSQAIKSGLQSLLHRFNKYYVPASQQFGLLPNQMNKWENMEQEAKIGGTITRSIPVDKLFTSQFIAGANDFDRATIIAQAKSYPVS